jgi:hypothetical protein
MMPEYDDTIRLGYKSVTRLQTEMRKMHPNSGQPFIARWIGVVTKAAQAQDAAIHVAIQTRLRENLETICSCGVIAKDADLDKTEGHLDADLQVLDVIIFEVKPNRCLAVCTACGTKRKTHKPLNKDDALVTSLRFRHRRACS